MGLYSCLEVNRDPLRRSIVCRPDCIRDRPGGYPTRRRHLDCCVDPDLVAFDEVIAGPQPGQLDELLAETGLHGTHQAVATRWPRSAAPEPAVAAQHFAFLVSTATCAPGCGVFLAGYRPAR